MIGYYIEIDKEQYYKFRGDYLQSNLCFDCITSSKRSAIYWTKRLRKELRNKEIFLREISVKLTDLSTKQYYIL